MPNSKRTALLIRCSVEEADAIRAAARKQDRTLSGYVMHALKNRLKIENDLEQTLQMSAEFQHEMKRVGLADVLEQPHTLRK